MSATINSYSGQWLPPRFNYNAITDFIMTNKLTVDDNPIPDGLDPIRIIVNGPATIVFWEDGTKTVVKCIDGEPWDIYHAFTAALAKKVYGNNSRIHKILKTKVEYQEDSNG